MIWGKLPISLGLSLLTCKMGVGIDSKAVMKMSCGDAGEVCRASLDACSGPVVVIRITNIRKPKCLPRLVALRVVGGGMTPPLRKTMTNPTSVTVSTGSSALPWPHPSLCFPDCQLPSSPAPGPAPWLASLCLHCGAPAPAVAGTSVRGAESCLGSFSLDLCSRVWQSLLPGSLSFTLLVSCKIHPLCLSLVQRVTNKSITQNPPTKVLGSRGFPFVFL